MEVCDGEVVRAVESEFESEPGRRVGDRGAVEASGRL